LALSTGPQQAQEIGHFADGVVIGSAVVKMIIKNNQNLLKTVARFVSEIKKALKSR